MSEKKESAPFSTGRRKRAVAKVRIAEGKGKFTVNSLPIEKYFIEETQRLIINEPLVKIQRNGKVDIEAYVCGGGKSGQAEAVRLGISRALVSQTPDTRPVLKKEGFLTRDSREKERKKYGRAGARKRFQFSKR